MNIQADVAVWKDSQMNPILIAQSSAQSSFWTGSTIGFVVIGIIVFVMFMIVAQFFNLWLQAFMSNASVIFLDLIGMRLRKVNLRQIVLTKIQLVKAGIHEISVNDLESHYLAGGQVNNV